VFDPRNPTLRRRLASGEPLAAFWFALGSVPLVEAAVAAGAEAVILDMQHGLFDRMGLEHAVGAVPPAVPCLVRVEDDSATAIGRALDAGAEGVIVPLVETGEQAREAAAACRYPPKGHRSGGGVRPLRDFKAHVAGADDVAVGVMIETRTGVENAAAIAGAEGVDFVFIGTGDLALSLGTAPGSEAHARACKAVLDACRKARTPCGIFTFDAAAAAARAGEGYVLTVATNDISATNEAFARAATVFREGRGGNRRVGKAERAHAKRRAR
jgi:2-keto-3-deoxy-L-rhamnonate aldolase RhmA